MTSRVRRLAMLKVAVRMIVAFFRTVCYVAVRRYGSTRMGYESYRVSAVDLLGSSCLTLALSFGLF